MKQQNAIIIGAGIGGLATAIHLARNGYKVTILEKNAFPGGRCGQIIKDGHYFDIGPTFLIFPDIYKEMFHALGENLEDHLDIVRVDPAQQICFEDNTKIYCTPNMDKMRKQLETIEPGSYERFKRFLEKAKLQHDLSLKKIINKDFQRFFEFFNLSNLKFFLKTNAHKKHNDYLSRFFTNQQLRNTFSFQDSYIGLNPYTSPAIFSLFSYSEFINGVWLPKGGMHQVVKALVTIAGKYDIKIIYKTPVVKIITDNQRVSTVVTKNEKQYDADVVVANADLPFIYQQLLPKNSYGEKLKRKKYSCSTITFLWGMKKRISGLETHNLFLSDTFKESYDQVISKHKIPVKPHFYIHAPTCTDKSMSPENQDTLTAIVPISHITSQLSQDWEYITKQTKQFVIDRLESFGIKNFKSQIKFEITITPNEWQQKYNLTNGSTLGLHHNITQMGYFRPKRQHAKYKNLYFVGSNTHPGSGVPTVLLSAYFTSKQITNIK